jgi:hypothetical protein
MRLDPDAPLSPGDLSMRLRALADDLAWSPPGGGVGGAGIRLFGPRGPDQRFVETPPSFTPGVREAMAGASAREHVIRLLGEERPVGYNIQHDAVSVLGEERHARLREFLACFGGLGRHEMAQGMRQALGEDLLERAGDLQKSGSDDPVLRALRESLLLAELCWALGLDSAQAASSVPVVVAAVEACAAIAGTLIELSPESDPWLDEEMLQRIHHARTAWIGILLRFDEHADLIADGGAALNERLIALVGRSRDPKRSWPRSFFHLFEEDPVPLVGPRLRTVIERELEEESGGDDPRPAAGDGVARTRRAARLRAVDLVQQEEEHRLLDVAARLLLPRYMVDEAVGLLQHLGANARRRDLMPGKKLPRPSRWAWPLVPVAIAGVSLMAIALGMFVRGILEWLSLGRGSRVAGVTVDRMQAVGDGLLVAAPAVRLILVLLGISWILLALVALYSRGRSASYLLLFRIPSATAFGLAILLALSFTWIGTQSGLGRVGPLVALLAAGVYSYVEFINQGGESRRPRRATGRPGRRGGFGRVVELTVLAGGMSLLVATLVLEVFGRTLLTQVPNYELLADPMIRLETLAILASISLALGTFLQAIWDEQTITAPLSYLRLRG